MADHDTNWRGSGEETQFLSRCVDGLNDETSEVAVGIDVVSIDRVRGLLVDLGDRFRESSFTPREQRYCDGKARPAQHYASRWAVKESFIKSISGWTSAAKPNFSSIEVVRTPEPCLSVSGKADEALREKAATVEATPDVSVSMAHDLDADSAMGAVIILLE